MSEEEIEKYKKAKSNILRGNDIESASYILEKHMDYYIIDPERGINPLRVAIKQILNYIQETKEKGILDVQREKVKLKNEFTKQGKVIDEMVEVLNDFDYDKQCESCHTDICSASEDRTEYTKCIKQYFYRKVEEDE